MGDKPTAAINWDTVQAFLLKKLYFENRSFEKKILICLGALFFGVSSFFSIYFFAQSYETGSSLFWLLSMDYFFGEAFRISLTLAVSMALGRLFSYWVLITSSSVLLARSFRQLSNWRSRNFLWHLRSARNWLRRNRLLLDFAIVFLTFLALLMPIGTILWVLVRIAFLTLGCCSMIFVADVGPSAFTKYGRSVISQHRMQRPLVASTITAVAIMAAVIGMGRIEGLLAEDRLTVIEPGRFSGNIVASSGNGILFRSHDLFESSPFCGRGWCFITWSSIDVVYN